MFRAPERREKESAKEYVTRALTDNIVDTGLLPGEKIAEQELCEALGVSRTPFREAELELAGRRLLEIRPKIGTYVSLIDEEMVEEVRHLRAVMEAEIARMCAKMATKDDLEKLWENVAVWEMYMKREQEEKIFELDKAFHEKLYTVAGRRYWFCLIETIAPHFDRTTILSFRCRPRDRILKDHEDLLRAIEKGDAEEAGIIASRHMERYRENIATIRETFPTYFRA